MVLDEDTSVAVTTQHTNDDMLSVGQETAANYHEVKVEINTM